jgi:hypothetical protein
MTTTKFTNLITLTDSGWFDDTDKAAYAYLTGVSGTNTIAGTGSAALSAYAAGQEFRFIPAATNTGATTINITQSGASALGAKNVFFNGAACAGGELKIGVPAIICYDGTQFNIVASGIINQMSPITNSLSGDVALNNTANYFTGPTVAQGTAGTWFVSGTVSVTDTAGQANIDCKLWDGTTVISSCRSIVPNSNQVIAISLSGYISAPAGNLRISVKDPTSTSGNIIFNSSGNSKDSTITAIRIA